MSTNLDRIAELDGLIDPAVGEAIYRHALEVDADQAIVELGAYRGKSTAYLAAGSRDGHGARVYSVDLWDPANTAWCPWCPQPTFEEWDAQLRSVRLRSRVEAITADTIAAGAEYAGPPVGLLFVDDDHAEDHVVAEVEAWRGHLAAGAAVLFDDYGVTKNPGVARAVARLEADGLIVPVDVVAGGRLATATIA